MRWLERPLPFRRLEDMGMRGYREFACSEATFEWLSRGAMTHVDGVRVWLQVMDRIGGNVVVRVWDAPDGDVVSGRGSASAGWAAAA